MKTNHQRNFKERSCKPHRRGLYVLFYEERHCELSDKMVFANVTVQDGYRHNGFARSRKGA